MVDLDARLLHVKWDSEQTVFQYQLTNLGKISKAVAGAVVAVLLHFKGLVVQLLRSASNRMLVLCTARSRAFYATRCVH